MGIPMPFAPKLQAATLMIHSDGCVLPQYTKNFFDKISAENKQLDWIETELDSPMQQFNFYDQDEEVGLAVEKASEWYRTNL